MKTYILLLGLSFILSVILTRFVRNMAHRFGWLDHPNERKIHVVPTPRMGGAAIFVALLVSLLPLLFINNAVTTQLRIEWPHLAPLPVAICGIFLVGLADDLYGVSPYLKLFVEVACSLWVFYHGIFISTIANPLGKPFEVGAWSLPITVAWLVGITNAFNLVDGIDGLAAGIGLFAIVTLTILSVFSGNIAIIALFVALAGATAGFLPFNFHPATVFLGDSGSLFLGFTLGSLAILRGQKSSLAVAVVGPILIFALPIADTGLAIMRRFINGSPLFQSDRDHIHHRLLALGFSHRKVVLLLYAVCFGFSVLTLALVHTQTGLAVFVLIPIFAVSWYGLSRLGYPEIGEINLAVRRTVLHQKDIITQRVQFRKASEAIGQAASLEELWKGIRRVGYIFDFDSAQLCLSADLRERISRGAAPTERLGALGVYWSNGSQSAFNLHPEKFWQIELPCGGPSDPGTRLILRRAVDKEELHLRLEPFVLQLSVNLTRCLLRLQAQARASAQAAAPAAAGAARSATTVDNAGT